MKKYFGYVRVSTLKQGEGVSLAEQKSFIEAYATRNQMEISAWFEEKHSAAKNGRPVFAEVVRQLKRRKADGVIIHKTDRGTRNYYDWADINALIDNGIEVHFTHEAFDLRSPAGRFSADIHAAQAIHYSRNLSHETKKGIYGLLKQGIFPLQAPVGYLNTGGGKIKDIDPVKAPLVRKAFELYATRKYSLLTLSAKMYKLGLTNLRGNQIRPGGLKAIFDNPFYKGVMRIKGMHYQGKHTPLVHPKLWQHVQDIMHGKTNGQVIKNDFVFRKMIRCYGCRYLLIGERQKGHIYYRCHTKDCPTKAIRETHIHDMLTKAFSTVEFYPSELKDLKNILKESQIDWQRQQEDLLKSVILQRDNVRSQLERLTDLLIDGTIDRDIYETRKQKLLSENVELQEKENLIKREMDVVFQKVDNFLELAKSLTKSHKKAKGRNLRDLVETVTSNLEAQGKKLLISMASPFQEIVEQRFLRFSALNRHKPRTRGMSLVYSETNTSPVRDAPLSRKQLKNYFNFLVSHPEMLEKLDTKESEQTHELP